MKKLSVLLLVTYLLGCTKNNNGGSVPTPPIVPVTSAAISTLPNSDTSIWYNGSIDISFSSISADSIKINGIKAPSVSGTISLINLKRDSSFTFESWKKGVKNTKYLLLAVYSDTVTKLCNHVKWIMTKRVSQEYDSLNHQFVGPIATENITCDTTTLKSDWSLIFNWGACNTFGWPPGAHFGTWHLTSDQKFIEINTPGEYWRIDTLNSQSFARYKMITFIDIQNPSNVAYRGTWYCYIPLNY